MFHYTTASNLYPNLSSRDVFYRPAPQTLSPRDKYLAAVAEAKAAEAEYLAAEAAQREEELALRTRLQEIELRRHQQQEMSLPHGHPSPMYVPQHHAYSASTYPISYPVGHSSLGSEGFFPAGQLVGYPITTLRSHVEQEEQHQRLQETHRRQEADRARFLALKQRKEAEERRMQLHQEEELGRLAVLRERELEARRQASFQQSGAMHRCAAVNQPTYDARGLVKSLFQPPQAAVSKPQSKEPNDVSQDIQQIIELVFKKAAQEVKPKPEIATQDPAQQLLELIFSAVQAPEAVKPKQKSKTSSPSNPQTANDSASASNGIQQLLNLFVGSETPTRAVQPQASGSKTDGPTSSTRADVEPSLKEALQARLDNEHATEIRDTIQAIFASLADPEPTVPTASRPQIPRTSEVGASNGKGKARATTPVSNTSEPSSKDVVSSMDEVRNIEAAFRMLESDFTFPSQIDFTPSSSASPTPAGSDSESSVSPTSRLSYTSRNHPVRFYEQALSALLSQLDSVDSFGNEMLRGRRKEVVGQVERALEELESEVEGRWRAKVAKEMKTFKLEITDLVKESVPMDTTAEESSAPLAPTGELSISASREKESGGETSAEIAVAEEPTVINYIGAEANTSSASQATQSIQVVPHLAQDVQGVTVPVASAISEPSATDADVLVSVENSVPEIEVNISNAPVEQAGTPSFPEHTVIDERSSPYPDTHSSESSSSIANSETTIRPYSTGNESDSTDAFLMSKLAPYAEPEIRKSGSDDTDVGSDWSEVEA